MPGVVIRLGRGFGEVKVEDGARIRAGTAVPDVKVSRAAQEAAITGLAFFRGIPGAIGGALRMNGGAYGRETKDALIEARAVDRQGRLHVFTNGDMHYTYRHCGAPDDVIFTQALFQGAPGDPAAIAAEMEKITESREATQPIKSRTGGSTFKNPPGHKAWQLIDAAGCRGLKHGAAQVSEMHCNFLINLGGATAADIETLGETVRRRVRENSGVELEWEIKRIGRLAPHPRHPRDGSSSLVTFMSLLVVAWSDRREDVALRVAGSLQPPRLSTRRPLSAPAGGKSISAAAEAEEA